jgi:hypothetical protein
LVTVNGCSALPSSKFRAHREDYVQAAKFSSASLLVWQLTIKPAIAAKLPDAIPGKSNERPVSLIG